MTHEIQKQKTFCAEAPRVLATFGAFCLVFSLSLAAVPTAWASGDETAPASTSPAGTSPAASESTESGETAIESIDTETNAESANLEATDSDKAELADAELLTCEAHPYQVVVTVENLRNLDGLLTVELYGDNAKGFLKKDGRLDRYRLKAARSEAAICLVAPGPGTYAVVLYHDENGNKKFDKNFLGIPNEGFGISNNPGFSLGPPAFEDAAIVIDEEGAPIALDISMSYL